MGRPKGGKNKYWSKEEKLKLIKEHLDNNISTNEITTRENISNGMYNNWLKKYLEQIRDEFDYIIANDDSAKTKEKVFKMLEELK